MTDYTVIRSINKEILGEIAPADKLSGDRKTKLNDAVLFKGKLRKSRRERRKNKRDRRKGVGGGVILSLSVKNERRKKRDRRN